MKTIRILLVLVLGLSISLPALAGGRHGGGKHNHHGGTRWSVGIGIGYPGFGYPGFGYFGGYPWYGAGYYPYGYYPAYYSYPAFYPAPVVVQQPTTYIELPAPQAQPQGATGYWYYCADQGAYYPYISECPAGWQRVPPRPSN